MARGFVERFLREHPPPPEVDAGAIRREWLALGPAWDVADRHLPVPIWARRRFDDDGPCAWAALRRRVPDIDAAQPLSVYIHVPFCAERCAFCDCYAFRLGAHRARHVGGYLDLLEREMAAWAGLGTLPARPVTTVHLGGGTPTFLGIDALARLVNCCRQHFSAGDASEWALESTATDLVPSMLHDLAGLGFDRLHVGVQSLDDPVRRRLNRRAPAAAVLETLGRAVASGWVVSVDLIYGLPGQTPEGMLAGIRDLAAAGVEGFSLYELQLSARNQPFARRYGLDARDRRSNYLTAQVASRCLEALGYRKTLFNHYAWRRDSNLYFTFPERDEDLLALGTVADGVFGDYHYRHPAYAAYGRAVATGGPGLQGGLQRTTAESRLQPLVVALMAGRVSPSVADASRELLAAWQASRLLAPDPEGSGDLLLTPSGSWFVGNMLTQLANLAEAGDG